MTTTVSRARRSALAAGTLGTIGSLLVAVGASQSRSPYTLKLAGAWWFGLGVHPLRAGAPRTAGLAAYLAVLAVLGGVALLGLAFLWLLRLRGQAGVPGAGQLAAIAVCWTLPMLVVGPLFSNDVYTYAAQGQMLARHLDPYRLGPAALGARDPFTRLTDPLWRHSVSPYGPLFLAFDQAVVVLGGHRPLVTVEVIRLACLAGVWSAALGAAAIARHHARDATLAFAFVALDPLLLLHLVAGAHDDAIMLGLLLVGLAAADGGRAWTGIALCALGGAVKAPALIGCAYIGWSCLAPRTAGLLRRAAGAATASVAAGALIGLLGSIDGLGWGWVRGLSNAGVVRLWMSPSTGAGMALGWLLRRIGIVHGRAGWLHTIAVTRGVGIAAAAVVLLGLLGLASADGPVRATGIALLAVAVLNSATWPWYLTWGVAALAPLALGRGRELLAVASVAASYLGVPVGSVVVGALEPAGTGALAADAALAAGLGAVVIVLARVVVRTTRAGEYQPAPSIGAVRVHRAAHS